MSLFDVNGYLLVTFCALLVYIGISYMRDTFSYLEKLGISGPKPVWIFGNVLAFKNKNILTVFEDWTKLYGKVYGFYEGFRAGLVVTDLDFAKEVLTGRFDYFNMRTSYRPFQYYPDNLQLVNLTDEQRWKNQRAMMAKALHFNGDMKPRSPMCRRKKQSFKTTVAEYKLIQDKFTWEEFKIVDILSSTTEKLLGTLEECKQKIESINISELIERYLSNASLHILLGMDEKDIERYGDTLYRFRLISNMSMSSENEIAGLARLFPSLTPLLKLADGEHRRSHEEVVAILRTYLQKVTSKENNNAMVSGYPNSVLSQFLANKVLTRDIDGSLTRRDLTHDEIVAHILSLLGEAFQTTAAMIIFILYELAQNNTCQDRLYQEICQVIGDGNGDEMTYKQIQSMKYCDQVFNETYRLHPVAPGLARVCSRDCVIKGITIPKGMPIRVMTSPIYSDESLFPNPSKFDPERFSPDNGQDRHPFSFLPFGQGPRSCPGMKLGMVMVKLAIAGIIREYRVTVNEHTEIPMKHTLRPSLYPANNLNISLYPRC